MPRRDAKGEGKTRNEETGTPDEQRRTRKERGNEGNHGGRIAGTHRGKKRVKEGTHTLTLKQGKEDRRTEGMNKRSEGMKG